MTLSRAYDFCFGLMGMLLILVLVTAAGCVLRQATPPGPPVDKDFERTNRAARVAFENGRIQQAADLYRQTLERAYLRDDLPAATDARYNLAVCLTMLQSDDKALGLVIQAREELTRAGLQTPSDIVLLEATIRYRLGDLSAAWQLTEDILNVYEEIPPAVQSKTHFLRGLIANELGDVGTLRKEIAALAVSDSLVVRADQEELIGYLALKQRSWDEAILAFDEAAALRRQILDYRGMVKALARAAKACEGAGRLLPASRRYLRAGQSAALQGNPDQAQIWLGRAVLLAEEGGDKSIAKEARLQLAQLQSGNPDSPADDDAAREGP